MTPFVYENEIVFCLTMIAYIIAMIMGVLCFAMSAFYKLKLKYVLAELAVSFLSALLFCYLSDGIRIRYYGEDAIYFKTSLCFMPTWSVITIALILIFLVTLNLILVVKKRLSALTAMSVKEAISKIPVGLCFHDETGRVLLLNERFIKDFTELIGESLYDGNAFWSSVTEGKVAEGVTVTQSEGSLIAERADGHVTMCKRIAHDIDGKLVYEICTMDISREFALKKEKTQKKNDLQKMKIRLIKYGEIVSELTREKEILAARIKVHSNLGSLIVRTKKELMKGEYDRTALIAAWEDILSLIFTSDDDEQDGFTKADKAAGSVGVKIFYSGKRPEKGSQAEKIFANAIFECITNTVRHADGTELYVTMMESETDYSIMISNNGRQPEQDIKEGGGISNLRKMVENYGGRMVVTSVPKFILTINISKENIKNERKD